MRVVGGSAKGISLKAVPGDGTRPILDRVKVALFDILRPTLAETNWLDLFAGTGQVGIEALSQGASSCIFLDLSAKAVKIINENLEATKLSKQAEVRNADAFGFLRKAQRTFDFIFVAPPQYKGIWIEAVRTIAERLEILNQDGNVIVQIDPVEYEKLDLENLVEFNQRKYGSSLLVFYKKAE